MTAAASRWARHGLGLASGLLAGALILLPQTWVATGAPLYPLLWMWAGCLLLLVLAWRQATLLLFWLAISLAALWMQAAEHWRPLGILDMPRLLLIIIGGLLMVLAIIELAARRGVAWLAPSWLRYALALGLAVALLRLIVAAFAKPVLLAAPLIGVATVLLLGLAWGYGGRRLNLPPTAPPPRPPQRLWLLAAGLAGLLAAAGESHGLYRLLRDGQPLLLPLATDARLLRTSPGRLRPVLAASAVPSPALALVLLPADHLVLRVDDHGIGRFASADHRGRRRADERLIAYRVLDQARSRPRLVYGPESVRLSRGEAARLAAAAYAVYWVDESGRAAWAGLAGADCRWLDPAGKSRWFTAPLPAC
ncbi:MAG: hypothetical protein Tsb0016_01460 [Sphingomonadales bacterium]